MNEEQLNTIEETIQDIPEEVKDFIFGQEMESVKNEINTHLETDEQRTEISNRIMFFLLGAIEMEELSKTIDSVSITEEKKGFIKTLIQEKIIDELLLIIEAHKEIDEESVPTITSAPTAPTPTEVLANLGARLSKSSVIVPSKRDYSMDKPQAIELSVENSKPTIDPYRELPEK